MSLALEINDAGRLLTVEIDYSFTAEHDPSGGTHAEVVLDTFTVVEVDGRTGVSEPQSF